MFLSIRMQSLPSPGFRSPRFEAVFETNRTEGRTPTCACAGSSGFPMGIGCGFRQLMTLKSQKTLSRKRFRRSSRGGDLNPAWAMLSAPLLWASSQGAYALRHLRPRRTGRGRRFASTIYEIAEGRCRPFFYQRVFPDRAIRGPFRHLCTTPVDARIRIQGSKDQRFEAAQAVQVLAKRLYAIDELPVPYFDLHLFQFLQRPPQMLPIAAIRLFALFL
jgi:hypothetical protein